MSLTKNVFTLELISRQRGVSKRAFGLIFCNGRCYTRFASCIRSHPWRFWICLNRL